MLAVALQMLSIERCSEATKRQFAATRWWARCEVCSALFGRSSLGHLEHVKSCKPRAREG